MATKLGDILLKKKTGTTLTLNTNKKYVSGDVSFGIAAQDAVTAPNTASADVSVNTSAGATATNISGVIGEKATVEPGSGYYISLTASGSGSSKVTGAGWVDAGPLNTASTTATKYFPITAATVTQNKPSVSGSGLVTATVTTTAGYTPANANASSNTLQLSTESGKTVVPTESEQTAVASGKYTIGNIKVGAISPTYVGTGVPHNDGDDITVSGRTVTVPAGYYAQNATAEVSVEPGSVMSGGANITSAAFAYNTTNDNFNITGSASIAAPSVIADGFISATEGTRTGNTASLSAAAAKIAGSTAISGATTKKPSIAKVATPSGVTNAASGDATTTAPASGVYVAVKSNANTGTLTATPSVTTAGYGTAEKHGIAGNTATVGAEASDTTYVPITTTTASLDGDTVSYGTGWITSGSKKVAAGTITSGSAIIDSASYSYNSSSGKFNVTGSKAIGAPSVDTAGYVSSTVGTKNGNTATLNTTVNKIVGSTGFSGASTRKPSISKQATPSGVVNAASGDATTEAPSSGVYVAVKTSANTGTLTATPSVTTSGYGTADYHGIAGNTITVGANASDTTYVPIATTSASVSGKTVSYGSGWITEGSKSVADGSYDVSVSAHSVSTTPVVTGSLSGKGTEIGTTTKPSGTDGTDYWAFTPGGSVTTAGVSTAKGKAIIGTSGYIVEGNKESNAHTVSITPTVNNGTTRYLTKAAIAGSSTNATATTTVAPGGVSIANNTTDVTNKTRVGVTPTTSSSDISKYYVAVLATAAANSTGTTSSITGSGTATVASVGYAPSNLTGSVTVSGTATAKTSAQNSAVTYLPLTTGALSASVSSNSAGSASMAPTGFTASSSATSYYVTLSTSAGSVKAKASVGTAGYVINETNETGATSVAVNGNGNKLYIPATSVSQGTTSVSGTTATRGTATWGNGYLPSGSIGAATFANKGTSGTSYVDISGTTSAPVLVAGDYLYINKGYTDNLKISLARLVPDGSDVKGHGDYILSGHSAYDNDGTLVAGSIGTMSASDISVDGKTVTLPTGKYTGGTAITKSISVGTVTSGSATISSASYAYNSTSGKFDVTGSASIGAPSVGTSGYISSTEGTRNGNTATLSTTVAKIVGSTSITGTTTTTPSISKQDVPSGVTQAACGAATTTAPSSGVYVAVKSAANKGTLTATPSVSTSGYGTSSYHGIAGNTATVGANESAMTYIPITTTTASRDGRTVSYGTGWITGGSTAIPLGAVTSGSATISSVSFADGSDASKFNMSGSANVSAPSVGTAGYISSSEGTRNANNGGATLSATVAKIVGSASISATTKTPSITKRDVPSGVTQAASGDATTAAPTSGVYVAVKSEENTTTLTPTVSISTAGYGTSTKHGISASGAKVGAAASATTYVPITTTSVTVSGKTASWGSGWVSASSKSVADGAITNNTTLPSGTTAAGTINRGSYIKIGTGWHTEKYYLAQNVANGSITNNTTLPSGKSSSGTINRGSYIKIGAGYYGSDAYYLAQANSGTKTITGSGNTDVNGYVTASVAAAVAAANTASASITKASTDSTSITLAESAPSSGNYYTLTANGSGSSKITTAGWIGTGALAAASATKVYYVTKATTSTTNGTTSATANAGTASIAKQPSASASATANGIDGGYYTDTTTSSYYIDCSASAASGYSTATGGSASASVTASSATVSAGYNPSSVTASTTAASTGNKTGNTATSTEVTKSANKKIYLKPAGISWSGGGLSKTDYSGTPTVSIGIDSQSTSGIGITDTVQSSGYYVKLTSNSTKLTGTTTVTRAAYNETRTAGYLPARSSTTILKADSSSPSVTVNAGTKTRYLTLPTATFNVNGASTYCVSGGWVPAGSTSSVIGTAASGTITNNTTLPSGVSSSGTINRGSYIKIGGGYYSGDRYYLAQNVSNGTITNNTSGGTSSGTINRGSQIKIGAGYYASDVYYTAQSNSGTKTITGSGNTDVNGYATASVAAAVGAANTASASIAAAASDSSTMTLATSAPSSGAYYTLTASGSGSSKITTAGWIGTGALTAASTTAKYYISRASTSTSNGTATATNGTASTSVTGMVTTSTNTGYSVSASATGGSASVTASSATVGAGYNPSSVTASTSAKSATGTSASDTKYIQKGVLSASVSSNSGGSASMAATGFTAASSATSYYVTLSTSAGSVKAKASVGTEGYVKSETNETSATSVSVSGNGTKLYVPAGGYSGSVSSHSITTTPVVTGALSGTGTNIGTTTKPSGTDGTDYWTFTPGGSVTTTGVSTAKGKATISTAGYIPTGNNESSAHTVNITPTASNGTPRYLTKASSSKTNGTASATANAGTASIAKNPSASASATANGMDGGYYTDTTTSSYYVDCSASAASGYSTATGGSASASVTASSVTVGAGYNPSSVTASTSASSTGTKTGNTATSTEVTASTSKKIYLKAAGISWSGGGLSNTKNYSGTPTVSVSLDSQSTSGISITDTAQSSGYYVKLTGSSSALSGSTTVTRAAYNETRTAGYLPARAATTILASTTSSPSVTVNANSKTRYLTLPTATFDVTGASVYCKAGGWVPTGSTSSVLKTIGSGTVVASVSSNTSGSASMAATGFTASSSATNYYVTLSTSAGSVKAKAAGGTAGYVTSSTTNETSATSVSVSGNGNKLYIPAGSASSSLTSSGATIETTNYSGISVTPRHTTTAGYIAAASNVNGTTQYINSVTLPKGKFFSIIVYTSASTQTIFTFSTDANGNTTIT